MFEKDNLLANKSFFKKPAYAFPFGDCCKGSSSFSTYLHYDQQFSTVSRQNIFHILFQGSLAEAICIGFYKTLQNKPF